MAQDDETLPVAEVEASKVKGKAKGKAKGKKFKGKGKAKGKKKAMTKASEEGAEGGEVKTQKAKPQNLKAQVMDAMKDRPIDDVVAEARAEVVAAEKAIEGADKIEKGLDKEIDDAKRAMDAASAHVETVVQKETVALEKLKAVRSAKAVSAIGLSESEKSREEAAAHVLVLEMEVNSRGKVSDYERERKEAQDAIVAAKKALEEAKIKEKESGAAAKLALIEQREKEATFLKEKQDANKAAEGSTKKDAAADQKAAAKASDKELKEIEKMRLTREKERQQKFREAAGLVKVKSSPMKRALMNAPHDAGGPASKAAKTIEDVD